MPVLLLAHAERGYAKAKEAGVIPHELRRDARKIEEIIVHDFAQLGVLLVGRAAPDRKHAFDAIVEQAFTQYTLPDHAGGAEQDDLHPFRNASKSALMVSASVVGMPCGKPL